MLNEKQQAELGFWQNLIHTETPEQFLARRKQDYLDNIAPYGDKIDLSTGSGLEVGTGCYSQLEFIEPENRKVISIDPLNDHFHNFLNSLKVHNEKVLELTQDGEHIEFSDNTFDWVVCFNTIDHTPHPEEMVSEMFRVLKPGGKLYFEVHQDDQLAPPHYSLWRDDTIEFYFKERNKIFETKIRNDTGGQYKYYAIYVK